MENIPCVDDDSIVFQLYYGQLTDKGVRMKWSYRKVPI